jgi:type IV pilus assembly protein PilA
MNICCLDRACGFSGPIPTEKPVNILSVIMILKRRGKIMKKLMKNRKGFTLIELIVVIAILGILAAILIPQFSGFQKKAYSTQVTVNAKQIATAADGALAEDTSVDVTSAAFKTKVLTMAFGAEASCPGTLTMSSTSNGHVLFVYTETVKTYGFQATRAVDATSSEVTLTVVAT